MQWSMGSEQVDSGAWKVQSGKVALKINNPEHYRYQLSHKLLFSLPSELLSFLRAASHARSLAACDCYRYSTVCVNGVVVSVLKSLR